ncbi:hypothetical protein ONO23_03599 [Micromonospora noduli]|uniref:Uncharacterized protein n=1 Tax=Micromonospora noduli TaxID=709876 RepID=A0A328NA18_9ACTN|nr:hypothetical protein [Micromonospora noduli]RAO00995.1 hypothetical protein LAH08_03248 [Micromonospora noduli]RAO13616.1 hypothetical protein LUPAC07_03908 [Micromonospora noduli]RAO31839.1 hypothetical protein ONO23_03599 [Micromonospora noduli]RAO40177.1 hypothetical protein ONO86_04218 [Micromonospora noduli]
MTSPADVPHLTPNQINALVVLMVEARRLTNVELKELAGFTLTGKDNTKLVDLGLVDTDRTHRPFAHELTEQGWRVARQLHTAAPPKQGGSTTRSLFVVLSNLHRSLDRLRVSHGDFFKQTEATAAPATSEPRDEAPAPTKTATTAAPAAAAPVSAAEVEALVRSAYRDLATAPGAWVGLADVRDRLADTDRAALDAALRAMVGREDVRIIPVANTKSLTARDRAAAVRIGNEDNHALAIGPA